MSAPYDQTSAPYPPPPSQYYGPPAGERYAAGQQQPPPYGYGQQPVQQQPTTQMRMVQPPPQPETYLIMSIFTCFCCNLICGGVGIYFSLQSDSAFKGGRQQEAEEHSSSAKKCNIAGIIFGIIELVALIIFVILWFVVFAGALTTAVAGSSIKRGSGEPVWG